MGQFPQTPYFTGLNEPVGREVALTGLEVQGTIPADVRGSFYRAVPDPAFPPKFADDHTLSGDGMVSRLSFNVDLAPGLERFEVPCMIIQPLVENAVLHGAEPLSRPVSIEVRAWLDDDQIVLEIADDGVGMPEDIVEQINAGDYVSRSESLGLQNVLQRLVGEYGPAFTASVWAAPDAGTRLQLLLPLGGQGDQDDRTGGLFKGPASNLVGNQVDFDPDLDGVFEDAVAPLEMAGNDHRVDLPIVDIVLEPIDSFIP